LPMFGRQLGQCLAQRLATMLFLQGSFRIIRGVRDRCLPTRASIRAACNIISGTRTSSTLFVIASFRPTGSKTSGGTNH
jgi:hypothetical protein